MSERILVEELRNGTTEKPGTPTGVFTGYTASRAQEKIGRGEARLVETEQPKRNVGRPKKETAEVKSDA